MTDRDKKDILQVLRDLLKHRTDDLGSYEFVLESWIEDAAAEIERLRAMMPIFRDTFAAAALTGLLAAPTDKDRSMDYWARLAYEAADAMLCERERVTKPLPKEKRAEVALTDEEREAIEQACDEGRWFPRDYHHIHTLRALMERLA